jgi:hypothetical protein
MNRLKFITFFPLLVFGCLHAQTEIFVDQCAQRDFQAESGFFSLLHTGRVPDLYPPGSYNDSPFLYSSEFIQGSLSYDGRVYERLLLNLNAHKDQLYILSPNKYNPGQMIEIDPLFIDFFLLKGEKFIYYAPESASSVLPGYYALLYEGSVMQLLHHTAKSYFERLDQKYQPIRFFASKHTYILIYNGSPYRLTGKKSLLKWMDKYPKEVRKFIRNEKLQFNTSEDNLGNDYARCVAFYESLIR